MSVEVEVRDDTVYWVNQDDTSHDIQISGDVRGSGFTIPAGATRKRKITGDSGQVCWAVDDGDGIIIYLDDEPPTAVDEVVKPTPTVVTRDETRQPAFVWVATSIGSLPAAARQALRAPVGEDEHRQALLLEYEVAERVVNRKQAVRIASPSNPEPLDWFGA